MVTPAPPWAQMVIEVPEVNSAAATPWAWEPGQGVVKAMGLPLTSAPVADQLVMRRWVAAVVPP